MWSRNATPVATFTRPRPSSFTRARRRVSLLLRAMSPERLLKADLHSMGVRGQPFHGGERDRRLAQHLEVAAVQAEHTRALEEGVDAKRRPEPGSPRRRQRVVG